MQPLYKKETNAVTRWTSFENPLGQKGEGGKDNGGAKGHAFEYFAPGETKVLLDTKGSGIINRMWMTVRDRDPKTLRSLKIEMFWDNAEKPAVSVPLGDFFCFGLSMMKPFESALFSSPEGKSFNCCIQMPFLTGAKITLTNESDTTAGHLFYDINYTLCPMDGKDMLYFHSWWNRENTVKLCRDYTVLDTVRGEGKFIGVNFGVNTPKGYGTAWFGEGEMKFYIDGDTEFPTLCGTGTEDYIGTAWGQGTYSNLTQGSLVCDGEAGQYTFYRLHTNDPVRFNADLRVTIQDIGGTETAAILDIIKSGAPCKIVTFDGHDGPFHLLYEKDFVLEEGHKKGWFNFYREDDFSSTAYFYLDKPLSNLPPLAPLKERIAGC